ncbi:MAG: prepilin-type N-terminal cleavage/methylation domain-containing protein [Thermodesulfobacteriota bacterium]|nr:prepilin-type N-terminal cleavage/methylation domain-containing protein [Thermodesulfobacteriota bacterium]
MEKRKTKILIAGKLNDNGFTLIELTVVVFLIGLMLLITVPRVRDAMLTDGLKSTVNYLTNTARELRSDAVRNQANYVLHLDLDNHMIWTYRAEMTPEARKEMKDKSYRLPEEVTIQDIYCYGKDKITDGEATVTFFKKGYVQPAVLHLAMKDRYFTLIFNPFLSTVETLDRYIDYSNDQAG